MQDFQLTHIYIYPIKSLGGISVQEAAADPTGLRHDRRWMLVDNNNQFMSQRTFPKMALLQVQLAPEGLLITHKHDLITPFLVPFGSTGGKEVTVTIWDDICTAVEVSKLANEWFSQALQFPARLVYMPDTTNRLVEIGYATNKEIVSFADAYPFLIIGQSSLDDLNQRLRQPVPVNRFRPNFVFTGGAAYCEDAFDSFCIGEVFFSAVKLCSRCVLTTVDQELATKSSEPLRTLASYRALKNKVMFGQNLLHRGKGMVRVGDRLTQLRWKEKVLA